MLGVYIEDLIEKAQQVYPWEEIPPTANVGLFDFVGSVGDFTYSLTPRNTGDEFTVGAKRPRRRGQSSPCVMRCEEILCSEGWGRSRKGR